MPGGELSRQLLKGLEFNYAGLTILRTEVLLAQQASLLISDAAAVAALQPCARIMETYVAKGRLGVKGETRFVAKRRDATCRFAYSERANCVR